MQQGASKVSPPACNNQAAHNYDFKFTVLGVILQLAGLGFLATAYSLFLKEQVGVTILLYDYNNVDENSVLINAADMYNYNYTVWLNSGQDRPCFRCTFSALCSFSSLVWEAS